MQNANHHLQCPSSPLPCIPYPTPKHKPPPVAMYKLLIQKGSLPTSPFATMVEPDWPLMDNKDSTAPKNPTRASAHNDQGQLPLLLFCAWTHTDYSERRLDATTFCSHQIKASLRAKHREHGLFFTHRAGLLGPCSVALPRLLVEPPESRLFARGSSRRRQEAARPKNQKMQIAGLRTLYKERVAGSMVGHIASGMWDDKHSILSRDLFPSRKS